MPGQDTGWFLHHLRLGEDRRSQARLKLGSWAAASLFLRILVALSMILTEVWGRIRWAFLGNSKRFCVWHRGLQREL